MFILVHLKQELLFVDDPIHHSESLCSSFCFCIVGALKSIHSSGALLFVLLSSFALLVLVLMVLLSLLLLLIMLRVEL